MNNELFTKLEELVETANILGRSLLLERHVNLVTYDDKGKIKSNHLYSYEEGSIKDLEARLAKIAAKQRQQWEAEFMHFLPTIATLGWAAAFDSLGVTLNDQNASVAFFPYNDFGLCEMADLLGDALIEQHSAHLEGATSSGKAGGSPHLGNIGTTCTGNCNHCGGCENTCSKNPSPHNCQHCDNDHCKQNTNMARLIWEKLSPDDQKLISSSLSPEEQEQLFAALGE